MKKLFILFFSLIAVCIVYAQPQATEGKTAFQKTQQPAAIITLPYPDDVVDKAIQDYMSKKGIKGNSTSGYTVYRNYKLAGAHDHNSDLYFKTDRKSRSEKDLSLVYLLVGKSTEDIKTRKLNDSTGNGLDGAKELLDEMVPSIDAYSLEAQIKDQEAVVKKAQKKYDDLVADQKDGDKKIRNLEDKLAQNKRDQQKQGEDLKKYINGDDKAMTKAQKKLRSLTNDESDYDTSLKNTLDKLEQNKIDQQRQQDEVNKQKDILSTLMAKRKG
ncbi:MAG TPA: hypothetical protein VK645_17760 [Chitinophagaceae bacterium]|nr:hypothetical protein [Chitinophagaceae bacterium]